MSKVIAAVLLILVGLCLLVGGLASMYTAYCLDAAGILIIILGIKMAMAMKCETKAPMAPMK